MGRTQQRASRRRVRKPRQPRSPFAVVGAGLRPAWRSPTASDESRATNHSFTTAAKEGLPGPRQGEPGRWEGLPGPRQGKPGRWEGLPGPRQGEPGRKDFLIDTPAIRIRLISFRISDDSRSNRHISGAQDFRSRRNPGLPTAASTPPRGPNRNTKLLEMGLTHGKQTMATRSNRQLLRFVFLRLPDARSELLDGAKAEVYGVAKLTG